MTVKVFVFDYGRKFLQLQWTDPATGRRRTESSGCTSRREASIAAQAKEKTLNAVDVPQDGTIPFEMFLMQLDDDVLSGVAERTAEKVRNVLNVMERFGEPATLRDVNSRYLSKYVGWLRAEGRAETTIQSHLRHIKTLLRWAVSNRYLPEMPQIPATPRASKRKLMKGRPITEAEFAELRRHIPGVVGAGHAANWDRLAVGLWLSGLRLGEAMVLSWDATQGLHVMLADRPKLRIPDWADKGHEDRILPITPDFAEFLLGTPAGERVGPVFHPSYTNHRNGRVGRYRSYREASRVLSAVGAAAKIIVDSVKVRGQAEPKQKYASAHDLRRSFGSRWSRIVTPNVLRELMRHSAIQTTMAYYVGDDADRTQDEVYRAFEKLTGNSATSPFNTLLNTPKEVASETR